MNYAGGSSLSRGDTSRIIVQILVHLMALAQFWGNEELIEESSFKNVLKQSIRKTLQLAASPKLDKSHLILGSTPFTEK
jgi:hypothetical protein